TPTPLPHYPLFFSPTLFFLRYSLSSSIYALLSHSYRLSFLPTPTSPAPYSSYLTTSLFLRYSIIFPHCYPSLPHLPLSSSPTLFSHYPPLLIYRLPHPCLLFLTYRSLPPRYPCSSSLPLIFPSYPSLPHLPSRLTTSLSLRPLPVLFPNYYFSSHLPLSSAPTPLFLTLPLCFLRYPSLVLTTSLHLTVLPLFHHSEPLSSHPTVLSSSPTPLLPEPLSSHYPPFTSNHLTPIFSPSPLYYTTPLFLTYLSLLTYPIFSPTPLFFPTPLFSASYAYLLLLPTLFLITLLLFHGILPLSSSRYALSHLTRLSPPVPSSSTATPLFLPYLALPHINISLLAYPLSSSRQTPLSSPTLLFLTYPSLLTYSLLSSPTLSLPHLRALSSSPPALPHLPLSSSPTPPSSLHLPPLFLTLPLSSSPTALSSSGLSRPLLPTASLLTYRLSSSPTLTLRSLTPLFITVNALLLFLTYPSLPHLGPSLASLPPLPHSTPALPPLRPSLLIYLSASSPTPLFAEKQKTKIT
ncbi:hypothetical protein NHX12_011438, partial [Muraenolepis orangiensis]